MKNKLLYSLLFSGLIISSFSCKKDPGSAANPDAYVKIKKNGTWVTYTKVIGELGPDLGDNSKTNFGVTVNSDDQSEVFDLTIQIDGTNFKTGAYNSDNQLYIVLVNYLTGANSQNLKSFQIDDAPGKSPSNYTINVTSITDTYLSGTFSGNYLFDYGGNGGPADVAEITEGEFRVKRIR